MVVATILFTHTTFLWATCCLVCFITIVKPFLILILTTVHTVYLIWKKGSRQVWLIDRGCLLLHGTWYHLWYIQRSVYARSLVCNSELCPRHDVDTISTISTHNTRYRIDINSWPVPLQLLDVMNKNNFFFCSHRFPCLWFLFVSILSISMKSCRYRFMIGSLQLLDMLKENECRYCVNIDSWSLFLFMISFCVDIVDIDDIVWILIHYRFPYNSTC
jgi:hypothetical protein